MFSLVIRHYNLLGHWDLVIGNLLLVYVNSTSPTYKLHTILTAVTNVCNL